MNIIDTIKFRTSVRNFNGKPLFHRHLEELLRIINNSSSPFPGDVTIRIAQFDTTGPQKPGTYGVINGACNYILLAYGNDDNSALAAGYRTEQLVLRATEMGLGTCWIAGTFKGSDFAQAIDLPEQQSLKVVIPIGIGSGRRHLIEKLSRFFAGSGNRKPFGSLFFEGDFSTPLTPTGRVSKALAMMRLAPSSTNSQPWRALRCGDTIHFYYQPHSSLSLLDMGIGLYHFAAAMIHYNRPGTWTSLSDAPTPPGKLRYVTSYTINPPARPNSQSHTKAIAHGKPSAPRRR